MRKMFFTALLVFAALISPAYCDQDGAIRLGEKTLFDLPHGTTNYITADQWSETVNLKLQNAVNNPSILPSDIKYMPEGNKFSVMAGPQKLFDIDPKALNISQEEAKKLAENYVSVLKTEFAAVKNQTYSGMILIKFLLSFIYPILFIFVIVALRTFYRWAKHKIHILEEYGVKGWSLGSTQILSLSGLQFALRTLLAVLVFLCFVISVFIFLGAVFYNFPVTRSYAVAMYDFIAVMGSNLGSLAFDILWRLVFVGAAAMLCALVINTIDKYFDNIAFGKATLPPFLKVEHSDIFEYLLKAAVIIVALVIILLLLPEHGGYVGRGLLIFLAFSLAISSVGILKNVMAGLVLAFSKTHNRGSSLTIDGKDVVIVRTGMFFTSLRLSQGEIFMQPNSKVIEATIRVRPAGDFVTWKGRIVINKDTVLSDLQAALEHWSQMWGQDALIKIVAIRDGHVYFILRISFLQSSSEVFLPAAFDELRRTLREKNCELLSLGLKS